LAYYQAQRDLTYRCSQKDSGYLVIKKGDVVHGVQVASLPRQEQKIMKNAEKRQRKSSSGRLLFFEALGVVRYAQAIEDLMPTRKRPTVPRKSQ